MEIKSYRDLQKQKKELQKEIDKEQKDLQEDFDFLETFFQLFKKKKKKEKSTSEPIQQVMTYIISNLTFKLFPRIKKNEKSFSIFTGVAASISHYISRRADSYFEKIFKEKNKADNQIETKKD